MASSKDRERELARRRLERRQQREASRRAARRRRLTVGGFGGAGVLALLLVVLLAANCGGSGSTSKRSASSSPAPSASPSASGPPGACAYAKSGPASKDSKGLPPSAPDRRDRTATVRTSAGTLAVTLLGTKAPCTVGSFAHLAKAGYFDGTSCHRLTTSGIYVLQCGDPTGSGTGGPGYQFADENLTGAAYPAGTLAMANAGPGTNGSQFFVVYKDTRLPPNYTPFGRITSGLADVQKVAAAGDDSANGPGDGHPKTKVTLQAVAVS